MSNSMDQNPYASPALLEDEQTVYYSMDIARATLGEIWRVLASSPIAFATILLAKLMGRPVRGNVGTAYGSVTFVEVGDLPTHVAAALKPIGGDCESLGFRQRFAHHTSVLGNGEAWAIASSNPAGTISSLAIYVRSGRRQESIVAFISDLDDETVLSTTNGKRRLKTPPEIDVSYLPGASVPQVFARHESRLAAVRGARPRSLDDAGLRQAVTKRVVRSARFHEARGVYVPLTHAEVARLKNGR